MFRHKAVYIDTDIYIYIYTYTAYVLGENYSLQMLTRCRQHTNGRFTRFKKHGTWVFSRLSQLEDGHSCQPMNRGDGFAEMLVALSKKSKQ